MRQGQDNFRKGMMQGLAAALLLLAAISGRAESPAVALFYGANPPWDELRAFDVVVVDPDHAGLNAQQHQHPDSQVFAYVSVGEVQPSRSWFAAVPAAWRQQANPAWGSLVIDQAAPGWPAFLADQVIAPLWAQGYRGFFLDTLDSWKQRATTPAQQAQQRAGLVAAIRAIKSRFPDARLIFNRGFEILPEVHDLAWMVAAESVFQGHDPVTGTVMPVSEGDRQWLLARLDEVRSQYRLPVLAIDYVAPDQRQLARQTADKIRALGMIPWVSTPALDALGVGAVEVLPRKVLVLWNPAESPEIFVANVQRLLAMPLAYLGLVIEYLPISSAPPAMELAGRYAGIVSWLRDPVVLEGTAWPQWLKAQTDKGLPLAVFGSFGFSQDASLRPFGLARPASAPGADLRIHTQDAMMGFELPVRASARALPAVQLAGAGRPLLGLQSAGGEQWHPAALMPWGGYVLAPYTAERLPAENQGERWFVNPVAFLRAALRMDASVPVPDVTTENGRRLFFSHVDGDGFANQFEGGGSRLASEVLRDDIFRRYQWPVTVSVIEGEVGPTGLYPQLSPRLEKTAQDIYALPWVEAATHTYSHPFFWEQAEDSVTGEGYHLDIPGYRFDMAREISGSADYINQRLLPAGKRTQTVFWTGNCIATPKALAEAARAGLLNMNGGETTITRTRNTWTRIAGLGLQRNGQFQVFAPNQNENVYTNNWTGPFYGFDRVIETFELTDRPFRFKPVDLYYHAYSGSKTASLNALHRIYAWVAKQDLYPVFSSEYIRKVLDFNGMVIARTPDGFRVRGQGELRTVRVPGSWPALPDFAASSGLAGLSPAPEGEYLHLTGASADISTKPAAARQAFLAEANARLLGFERRGRNLYFGLDGHVPLALALGNAQGCRLFAGDRVLPLHHQAAGLNHYRLEHHAESAFKLDCGA